MRMFTKEILFTTNLYPFLPFIVVLLSNFFFFFNNDNNMNKIRNVQ